MSDFSPSRLRARREAANLAREHLAVACNRSVQAVYRWETGRGTPSRPSIVLMARCIGCKVADLLCEPSGVAS
ncbi:MAG: helix-turn-helix domain-containing protein [Candidatus Dormibacteria bacterium]